MHCGGGDVEGAHHHHQDEHHHHEGIAAVEEVHIVSSFFSYTFVKILNPRSVDAT